MKAHAHMKLVVLATLAAILAACDLTVSPPTPAEQNLSPLIQAESPLPSGADRLDSADSYHVMARYEARHAPPDGSLIGGIVEYHYYWMRSEGEYGYNEHTVLKLLNPDEGAVGVMEDSYYVDDLVFSYCSACLDSDNRAGVWSVTKRGAVTVPLSKNLAATPAQWPPVALPFVEFVPQGVVIGNERVAGIGVTHYQLLDPEVLSTPAKMRIGLPPHSPLELSMAQMDIWLTTGDQRLIQYSFQVEGSAELVPGTQVLEPFTLLEQYNVTEINSTMPITVPAEVLTAVEPQLKALEN